MGDEIMDSIFSDTKKQFVYVVLSFIVSIVYLKKKWYEYWVNSGLFSAKDESELGAYSIVIPPPNVTGVLTMGHVINNTIQDIYIRRHRMEGMETCWFPGLDHAGIATQTKVEQQLRESKLTRHDLGREKFLEKVWEWRHQYGDKILQQLHSLGISCDWNRREKVWSFKFQISMGR